MADKPPSLDPTDVRVIDLLRADGRLSVNAIAEHAGVSRANAYRRLDRLQDEGVITGFTARVDPALVGRPITVLLLITVQQRRWRSVREALTRLAADGLEFLAVTTGTADFVALVRTADPGSLSDVVLGKIRATPGVVNTQMICVLEELALSWPLLPQADADPQRTRAGRDRRKPWAV